MIKITINEPHLFEKDRLYKVTHSAGHFLSDTRPHELQWIDWEMGTGISRKYIPNIAAINTNDMFCCVFFLVHTPRDGGVDSTSSQVPL